MYLPCMQVVTSTAVGINGSVILERGISHNICCNRGLGEMIGTTSPVSSIKNGGCMIITSYPFCLAPFAFKYTSNMLKSAGDTPVMREACPKFAGLSLVSFC